MDSRFYNDADRDGTSTRAPLKAFLTPYIYCDQGSKHTIVNRDEPPVWEGYHWFPWSDKKGGFPDNTGYVWGYTATPNLCPK
mmetsp:Transcript_7800/g.16753  ORF Transcript_7800/g.16753 Transcript_7800/m.16753 type:complete len:82 (-) Transcript_7800:23-268(-)